MTIRDEIVAAARALIGTPFRHQGRVPGIGLDCAGVPITVGRALGLLECDFDVTGYPAIPDGATLRAHCDRAMRRIDRSEMQPGDVILIAWGSGAAQHLGILVPYRHGGLSMVHAESLRYRDVRETRVVFNRVMRLVQAYALPGVF